MRPWEWGAAQAAARLAAGDIGALELTDMFLARIAAGNASCNAVVVLQAEAARDAARDAERARARGDRRPLLGVPVTVKESFHVADWPCSWGLPPWRDFRSTTETLAVQRLRAAGAVILGKTNVAAGLVDWQCDNPVYGRTCHPTHPGRTAGGSSGGSAAAIAAGFSALELGSDVAGSIRVPANFCGVYGHRPSAGIVPTEGYGPPPAANPAEFAAIGPLARRAEDLELALRILAGPPPPASKAFAYRSPQARIQGLPELRVLVLDDHPSTTTCRALRLALAALADRLRRLGAQVSARDTALPDLTHTTRVFLRLLMPQTASRLAPEERAELRERVAQLPRDDNGLAALAMRARLSTVRDVLMAREQRAVLRAGWAALFHAHDVVICPSAPVQAFAHDDRPVAERKLQVDDRHVGYLDLMAWPSIATLCGLPCTAIPLGVGDDGLPLGAQVIGPPFEDLTPIRVAELLQAQNLSE